MSFQRFLNFVDKKAEKKIAELQERLTLDTASDADKEKLGRLIMGRETIRKYVAQH